MVKTDNMVTFEILIHTKSIPRESTIKNIFCFGDIFIKIYEIKKYKNILSRLYMLYSVRHNFN